jgi:hypothetical protein
VPPQLPLADTGEVAAQELRDERVSTPLWWLK